MKWNSTQTGERLGVHRKTVLRLAREGKLHDISGKNTFKHEQWFDSKEVLALAREMAADRAARRNGHHHPLPPMPALAVAPLPPPLPVPEPPPLRQHSMLPDPSLDEIIAGRLSAILASLDRIASTLTNLLGVWKS